MLSDERRLDRIARMDLREDGGSKDGSLGERLGTACNALVALVSVAKCALDERDCHQLDDAVLVRHDATAVEIGRAHV